MKNLIESILDDEDTIINGIDDVRVTVEHKIVDVLMDILNNSDSISTHSDFKELIVGGVYEYTARVYGVKALWDKLYKVFFYPLNGIPIKDRSLRSKVLITKGRRGVAVLYTPSGMNDDTAIVVLNISVYTPGSVNVTIRLSDRIHNYIDN